MPGVKIGIWALAGLFMAVANPAGAQDADLPLILYHPSQRDPAGGGIVMVRDRISSGAVTPDGRRFVNNASWIWSQCMMVDAARMAALQSGQGAAGLLALTDDQLAAYGGTGLFYERKDRQQLRAGVQSFESYDRAHRAAINAAIIEAYQLQYDFVRQVSAKEYRDALRAARRDGSLPPGEEAAQDALVSRALDARINELALLEQAADMARRDETPPYPMLFTGLFLLGPLEGPDSWPSNPFHTLGLAARHPDLARRAREFRQAYEGLGEIDSTLAGFRRFDVTAYTAGNVDPGSACSAGYDVRVTAPGRRMPYDLK